MLSGGGPGAMEATHLGAWMANFDDDDLDAAIADARRRGPPEPAPGREYADPDWLDRAFAVRERWPLDGAEPRYESIGIPTWMYGHEPPTAFATKIAKYFANSVREEGLLADRDARRRLRAGQRRHDPGDLPGRGAEPLRVVRAAVTDGAARHAYWTEQHPVWAVLESLPTDASTAT